MGTWYWYIPRTQNSDIFFPGSPLDCIEMIPATRPPKALAKLVAGNCKLATSTEVTAPVADTRKISATEVTAPVADILHPDSSLSISFSLLSKQDIQL